MAGVIVDHEVAEGGVILRSGVTVAGVIVDYNVTVRCGYAVGGAFAVDSMAPAPRRSWAATRSWAEA